MAASLLAHSSRTASRADRTTNRTLWAGRILSGIAVLFLTFDTVIKLFASKEAIDGTVQLGWSAHHLPILALIEVVCLTLYLIPRKLHSARCCGPATSAAQSPRICGSTTRSSRTHYFPSMWPFCCGAACTCAMHAFAPCLARCDSAL